MTQYSLQFVSQTDFAEESYIPTESNKEALDWINKWPEWGNGIYNNIIYIFGEEASGKTHLTKIWQNKSNAILITKSIIQNQSYFDRIATCYILEDIESFIDQPKYLFMFINYIINSKSYLIITSKTFPSKRDFLLPDLNSRINSFLTIEIKKPDEKIIGQILLKYFADKQISVTSNVIHYLTNRIDRSYKKIADIVDKLDKDSMLHHKKISINMVKSSLDI